MKPRLNPVDYGAVSDSIDVNFVKYGEESKILMKLDPEKRHRKSGFGVAW